jgi:cytochrome c biogenesis protein CcdA
MAIALALLFGMVSSFGPCMISRFAILSTTHRSGRASVSTVIFLAGIVTIYVLLAFSVSALGALVVSQNAIDAAAATLFATCGLVLLWRQLRPTRDHDHKATPRRAATYAGMYGIGLLSGLNLNPCCAPWLFMALAITAHQRNLAFAATLMVAFGIGHGIPLLLYGTAANRLQGVLDSHATRTLLPLASVALMFWLAIYYGVQV